MNTNTDILVKALDNLGAKLTKQDNAPGWSEYVPENAGCMRHGGHDPVWPKVSKFPAKAFQSQEDELVDPSDPDGPKFVVTRLPMQKKQAGGITVPDAVLEADRLARA